MNPDFTLAQKLAIWALPVLFAITLREIAHGYAARRLGDETASRLGRLSPNPLRHIDPIGTVVVPALLVALGGFLMGWPKQIPIDFGRLRNPKRDMALVALAGLGANAVMALAWTGLLKLSMSAGSEPGIWMGLRYMGVAGISINLALFVINLLPIPPLDGGRVLIGLLPLRQAQALARIEPYSLFILIALMMTPVLSAVLYWPMVIGQTLLFAAFDIDTSLLL